MRKKPRPVFIWVINMNYNHRKVDKVGKIIVDSLLLVLLWGLLVLPASTFSLLKLDTSSRDVLSGQDLRDAPINPEDETKTYRELESNTGDFIKEVRNY